MSALLVAALIPPAWVWFHRLERQGRSATVVTVIWLVLIAETCLYPNQNTIPSGLFHPALGGGFSFRLFDVLLLVAVGARLSVRGFGRFSASGLLWVAFIVWLGVAAVIGFTGGNALDKLTFEAKAMIYMSAIFLTATVPAHEYVDVRFLRRLIGGGAIAATILLITSVSGISVDIGARAPDAVAGSDDQAVSPLGALGPDLATILIGLGVVAIALALYAPRASDRARLALCAAPLLASAIGPGQRAAVLGLAVTLLTLSFGALVSGRRIRATPTEISLAAAAVIAFGLAPTLVYTARGDETTGPPIGTDLAYSFTSRTEQLTTQDRINQWDQAEQLVAERPVFGWGLGKQYEYYEPGRHEFLQVDITHNIGWDLLVRSGVIGLGLFLAALGVTLGKTWTGFTRLEDGRLAALCLGLTAALCGMIAKGMVESIFEKYRLAIALALLIGMALSVAGGLDPREREEAPEDGLRALPA